MAMLSTNRSEVARATLWGGLVAALVIAGIVLGSRGLKDFDTALVPSAGATVFAAFGLGYRYVRWLQRPPTRLYWFRGWQILFKAAHPPAEATTLIISLGAISRPLHLVVIEAALVLLVLQAIAINRLAGLDYPFWLPRAPR
jgi:hypothetical protein